MVYGISRFLSVVAEVKSEFMLEEFEDSPEDYDFTKKYRYSIICYPKNRATALLFKFFQLICNFMRKYSKSITVH